jgi:MoaA/NifB/PqqE/SkfB family radical SAM enzyme
LSIQERNSIDMPPHHHHPQGNHSGKEKDGIPALRLVAWETTRNCNLSCVHCRASATCGPYSDELDTQAAYKLLDQIAEVARPIIILTGGEPLMRNDIFDIAAYGNAKGMRMVMSPNGTLVTQEIIEKMVASGIQRLSISLDGAGAESHDRFRGVEGAYDGALRGIRNAKAAGIEFQINTTITKTNLDQIPKILELAESLERRRIISSCWSPPGAANILWIRRSMPVNMSKR